jgi:AcrR family transcriptional regulator
MLISRAGKPPAARTQVFLYAVQILYAVQKLCQREVTVVSVPTIQSRRPGRRRTLTEDEILDAALELLDEDGTRAASIRRIAARVGVAPNAVYTYFADKAAVERALVERLLGQVDQGVFTQPANPWRQRVESLALELRTKLAEHPGAVPLLISRPMDGPAALTLNERLLGVLADGGLDPDDAARAAHLLVTYVVGSVCLEVADAHQPGALPPEELRRAARRRVLARTPAGAYPRTSAAAPVIAGYVATEQYLWGLRRVLDGITDPSDREPVA